MIAGMLLAQHAGAHEGHEHGAEQREKTAADHVVKMNDMTYLGSVDRVIGGHPYRTVGRRYAEDGELEFSEVRSDGVLVKLETASRTLPVAVFPPFEHAPPRALAGASGFAELPLDEMQPSMVVVAQSRNGDIALYDRARGKDTNHPHHKFAVDFDAAIKKENVQSGKPGTYIQVLPYLEEGPVDFTFDSVSEELAKYLREPFKFHFAGINGHSVVDGTFVVLPRKPVLVEAFGGRYVFYGYIFSETER